MTEPGAEKAETDQLPTAKVMSLVTTPLPPVDGGAGIGAGGGAGGGGGGGRFGATGGAAGVSGAALGAGVGALGAAGGAAGVSGGGAVGVSWPQAPLAATSALTQSPKPNSHAWTAPQTSVSLGSMLRETAAERKVISSICPLATGGATAQGRAAAYLQPLLTDMNSGLNSAAVK